MSKVGKAAFEKPNDKNYKLFAVTFHGHFLDSIRHQFIRRALAGTRRRVIIIDLDKERSAESEVGKVKEESHSSNKTLASKSGAGDGHDFSEDRTILTDMSTDINYALNAIQREIKSNAETTNRLIKEKQFNLIDYWMESLRHGQSGRHRNSLIGRRSLDKDSKKNRLNAIKEGGNETPNIVCTRLKPQRHNVVGRPARVGTFIEDEPENSKLFIVIIGNFENTFYLDLLSRGEPLQAIFNFLPDKTPYELLVPNSERRLFVEAALDRIEQRVYSLRANAMSKPTGIFTIFLPVISSCLAEKYTNRIYDQLTWAFYDVEVLYQHYMTYYIMPFNEIDVAIPETIKLIDSYRYADRLYLQGNYLMTPLPGIAADNASIILYLDMLFSTIDNSEGILTEFEMILLSTPLPKRLYGLYKDTVSGLAERYADAFHSITKLKKVDRLFLEANNKTLVEMIQYVDHEKFRHIYLACLEYKVLRKYLNNVYENRANQPVQCRNYPDKKFLPPFVKLHATDDGIAQRLLTLMDEYDGLEVHKIKPNYNLYHFQRNLNEIIECNRMYVIPTRLCFRDFTLYQMEEFLKNLITPEVLEHTTSSNLSEMERFEFLMRRYADGYNPDIFVRPNSLKARRMEAVSTLLSFKQSTRRAQPRKDSARERELQMAAEALMDLASHQSIMGLPSNHPLLTGYNLENIRQEIWLKTSKYYFEEGHIQLYDERWCFNDTNKNLSFKVNENYLVMGTPYSNLSIIKPQIRLTTKNDIAIRMHENPMECAKIVLNYPNGLTIYYEDNHVEQLWSRPDTPLNEKRRIMTPFGAVIVEYKSEDLIVVMRYNGEVYRLYQYEFTSVAGEDEDSLLISENSAEPDRTTLSSVHFKMLIQNFRKEAKMNTPSYNRARIPKEARLSRQVIHPMPPQKKRATKRSTAAAADVQSISMESTYSMDATNLSMQDYEKEIIANELEFLKKLSKIYGLSYKHLIVTTTVGRVFNLLLNGKCYETFKLYNEDWHDYHANESYAMREDDVKMIWGKDYFKCFHADGTVLTTQIDDVYHIYETDDEFAYSQSSSHMGFEESSGDRIRKSLQFEHMQRRSSLKKRRYKTYEPYLKTVGEVEEDIGRGAIVDAGYMCLNIVSQCTYHKNYASVQFLPQLVTHDMVYFLMEVKGLDEITMHRTRELLQSATTDNWQQSYAAAEEESTFLTDTSAGGDAPINLNMYANAQAFGSMASLERATTNSYLSEKTRAHLTSPIHSDISALAQSRVNFDNPTVIEPPIGDIKYEEEIFYDVLKIWIGNDFFMLLSEEHFEIHILLERNDAIRGINREKLEFRFIYAESLQDLFQKIVARISAFKKYNEPKSEEVFFLEKLTENCETKGIEFLNNLTKLGDYTNEVGNTITEFTTLKNIMEKFQNNFEWYEKDMAKFPRFNTYSRKSLMPIDNFPMVLSVNTFLKVPENFRSVEKVHKFLDSLDTVNFKKTRYQIKETMSRYVHPHIAKEVHKLYSKNSWRRHHEEQRRQKLIEAQRMGLYHAILRHKTYPNYFLFSQKYLGQAKHIDYFDYCLQQCAEKEQTASPRKTGKRSKAVKTPQSSSPQSTNAPLTITENYHSLPADLDEATNMGMKWLSAHSV